MTSFGNNFNDFPEIVPIREIITKIEYRHSIWRRGCYPLWVLPAQRYANAMAVCLCLSVCLSVCLFVTSGCSFETAERIELVFSMGDSFHLSYTVLKGNTGISKNKGTFLSNFAPNSGLRKFRHDRSIVQRVVDLARERWTLRA